MGRVKGVTNGEGAVAQTCMGKIVGLYMLLWGHAVHRQQEMSLEKMHRMLEFDANVI